jgi:C4-dicarboxylate transporter DctM subunit
MAGLILFVVMFGLIAGGLPIAFAMGLASLAGLLHSGDLPLTLIGQRMMVVLDSFPLLAVPLFVLAGEIMTAGACSRRLVDFAMALVGHIRGSLAQVTVLSSMLFSGMSGSASADAAAVGSLMIPAMIRRGYDRDFATAIQASAATMAPIIPPSILMVIFGFLSGVSVSALFLAGIVPGVLVGLALMVTTYIYARRRGDAYRGAVRPPFRQIARAGLGAFPALGLPALVLGGMRGGVFTPTEAAGVAVLYGLAIELLLYRELELRMLPQILRRSAMVSAMVMFIVAVSGVFAWVLTVTEVPQVFTKALLSVSDSPAVILFLVNVMILLIGTSMEATSTLLILTPILMPLVGPLGIDPVHFGVIVVVGLCVGQITPPVGLTLFVACGISGRPVAAVVRPLLPQLAAIVAVLMLITYVPWLVTVLPRLIGQ